MCLPFILTLPGSPFSPFSPCCPAEPGVPLSLTKKRAVSYLQQGIKVGTEGKIRFLSLAWFPQKRPIKVPKRMHLSLLMVKKRNVNVTWPFQTDSATCRYTTERNCNARSTGPMGAQMWDCKCKNIKRNDSLTLPTADFNPQCTEEGISGGW